jgi:hypothetical protein
MIMTGMTAFSMSDISRGGIFMKKRLAIGLTLVLVLAFGVIAFAEASEVPQWYNDMREWRQSRLITQLKKDWLHLSRQLYNRNAGLKWTRFVLKEVSMRHLAHVTAQDSVTEADLAE